MFFRVRRKILAPGILREVLVRIGLPTAKMIVTAQDLEAASPKEKPEPPKPKPELKAAIPIAKEEAMEARVEKAPTDDTAATFVENPELDVPGVTVLDGEDFTDIADALNAVESLSDSFMAAKPKTKPESVTQEQKQSEKPGIRINIGGSDEITSAPTTFATTPLSSDDSKVEEIEEPERVDEVEELEVEVPSSEDETTKSELVDAVQETDQPDSEIEVVAESIDEDKLEEEIFQELDQVQEKEEPISEVATEEPAVKATPAHVVKPLVQSKILILGEAGVGKQSLMRKADLEPVDEDALGGEPYIHTKVVETENHRVRVNVWSFDEAVKSKISRNEFYNEAEALIIVYAASDRWSFESIDFWLKEATITTEEVPPIVIVANKTDLVKEFEEDAGDQPVTREEGFALAESLAGKFGSPEKLHPVAFIGTSCLTGEGVFDVFTTSAELAAHNKPID